jgi:magnesium-transporting ATPase (P-type)
MRQTPRGRDDPIVTRFMFVRYLVIGCYVGLATIGGFAWWYMYATAGPQMSWAQLTAFSTCEVGVQHFANGYGCEVFGHAAAATVALSVLVTIEMFNACNAVSEDESMLRFAPWTNGWLMLAIATSFALHFCILHVAALNEAFGVVPLGKEEWLAVVAWSAPVVVIDEVLKAVARSRARTISRTGSRKSD